MPLPWARIGAAGGSKSNEETRPRSPGSNVEAAQGETIIMPDKNASDNQPTTIDGTPVQEVNEHAQIGVQQMEAVTLTWNKISLGLMFIGIWFIFLLNGFRLSILAVLTPFITSDWEAHSLLTVITIVSSAIAGAVYIPMAKLMDLWGRAESYLLMFVFAELGLILSACSTNLATYCAAQVFYSVGFAGLIYSIEVLAIDGSNLRNRGLAFAFTSSPYMITAFAGPAAATAFLDNVSWEWGFGCFAIIYPFFALPLYGLLKWNLHKAKKQGLLKPRERSGRTLVQSCVYWLNDFDILGVFLFAAGFVIFLLPFTLASSAPHGWGTGYIIAMIVVGLVLLCIFAIWEIKFAPVPFLQGKYLLNHTVLGACLIDMTYQTAYYCWYSYFSSFLQVVNGVSTTDAGYIVNIFEVVSGVELFIVGYFIRRTGKFKWTFYPAIPIYILAQGLMIYFRRPGFSVGYLIMCQVFTSIGGAVFILTCQLACLAAVEHQYVTSTISLLFVSGSIGDSVGAAISGAIWTNTFLPALERYLPESAQADIYSIYEVLTVQLEYPEGSPTRIAIQEAYAYSQTRMLAAGTGIMALCFVWVFLIQDLNVKDRKQTKGVVF